MSLFKGLHDKKIVRLLRGEQNQAVAFCQHFTSVRDLRLSLMGLVFLPGHLFRLSFGCVNFDIRFTLCWPYPTHEEFVEGSSFREDAAARL